MSQLTDEYIARVRRAELRAGIDRAPEDRDRAIYDARLDALALETGGHCQCWADMHAPGALRYCCRCAKRVDPATACEGRGPFAVVMPLPSEPRMNWHGLGHALAVGAAGAVSWVAVWAAWHWARVAWEVARWWVR